MVAESLIEPLPPGWEATTLGEACRHGGGDIQTGPFGSQLHASDYVPEGIPTIMPQNIGDNRVIQDGIARITPQDAERLARYRLREGDIVYSRRGDVERRALIRKREDGWLCGTGSLRVRLRNGNISPIYASYYLGHPAVRAWIVRHAIGATMPNLNTSIMAAVPFVVPPKREQDAIAHVLSTLDDNIELNRRMNETLEAIAEGIFKSWFVDFDPVRAKAEGSDAGLPKPLSDLFPDSFEDSELGEIPKGWRVENVGDIIELAYGKALKEDARRPGHIPVFGSNGQVGWHDEKLVDGPGIVVGRKGNPGIVTWAPTDFFAIDTTFYVVPRNGLTSAYFLFYALRGQNLASLGADSAVPGLNRNLAYMSRMLVPVPAVVDAFDGCVRALFDGRTQNDEQSRTLAAQRDMLLPELISGKLRIQDAENVLGGTL